MENTLKMPRDLFNEMNNPIMADENESKWV